MTDLPPAKVPTTGQGLLLKRNCPAIGGLTRRGSARPLPGGKTTCWTTGRTMELSLTSRLALKARCAAPGRPSGAVLPGERDGHGGARRCRLDLIWLNFGSAERSFGA
jgi:hypothetical protein